MVAAGLDKKRDPIKSKLTREDLSIAKEMVELLHPFKVLTEVLSRKNNYAFIYVPVVLYMRNYLRKMHNKYALTSKFKCAKAIDKVNKYLKLTAIKNPILYLCDLFVPVQQKMVLEEYKEYDSKGLSAISMLVDIAYKLGKVANVESKNQEVIPMPLTLLLCLEVR